MNNSYDKYYERLNNFRYDIRESKLFKPFDRLFTDLYIPNSWMDYVIFDKDDDEVINVYFSYDNVDYLSFIIFENNIRLITCNDLTILHQTDKLTKEDIKYFSYIIKKYETIGYTKQLENTYPDIVFSENGYCCPKCETEPKELNYAVDSTKTYPITFYQNKEDNCNWLEIHKCNKCKTLYFIENGT